MRSSTCNLRESDRKRIFISELNRAHRKQLEKNRQVTQFLFFKTPESGKIKSKQTMIPENKNPFQDQLGHNKGRTLLGKRELDHFKIV